MRPRPAPCAPDRHLNILEPTIKIVREVSAVINRLLLTLCCGVGIFAASAAPASAADENEAKAQACPPWHRPNGLPAQPKAIPILWGQPGNYLYKELHDY